MSLHLRLKNLRGLRKLTQQQMADQLHMTRPNYSKLEKRPTNIRIELLQRMAAVLQVPPGLLFSAQLFDTAESATAWNEFDLMLEMAYEHMSYNVAVIPYDELTLEQLALVTSKGYGSREAYENTPLQGRLYSHGPRQILDQLFRGLGFSTLFEHYLVEHPTWLQRWATYSLREERQKVLALLPAGEQENYPEEPEVDERDYLLVFSISLNMPDGTEQHLELAQRDIPEGLDEEQALQQLIRTRGAVDGDIRCFTFDGYTMIWDIVTDIYSI
ncbi:helix-turn-helix transcriptional regulator [Hymenobacter sp. NST-14]|uniref:helix-turn-helix domain-containing protein n=1 Tax=Hymenobacter piscis TaxID=2839984 RepID=UPI001C0090F2|nr:helix-turn-helix transcriptional regulator [Hymenobacter piscis]MBT9394405.1 helix-turn-helix transcriptional regulator [Hymenobacter piscis]